jgi:long-subunit fatty acid transport protein
MRVLFLLLILSNYVLAQTKENSKFSVSLGANPFILAPKFITDLNFENQGEEVVFNKSDQLSSEIYLTSCYNLNKKWKVGLGLSYIQTNYKYRNYIETSEWQRDIPQDSYYDRLGNSIEFSNDLKSIYLGLKLQIAYSLNETNLITVGLDLQKFTSGKFENDLSGIRGDENVEIREVPGAFYQNKGVIVVPEIFMTTRLYKNLNFTCGAKMRFWNNKTKNLYELSYQHYDYTVIDFKISTRNFGFFIGLNYQFQKKN